MSDKGYLPTGAICEGKKKQKSNWHTGFHVLATHFGNTLSLLHKISKWQHKEQTISGKTAEDSPGTQLAISTIYS